MTTWTLPGSAGASDPGRTTGRAEGYAAHPDCTCRHAFTVHDISERTKKRTKKRTACSAADPVKCGCKAYQSAAADAVTTSLNRRSA